jgi:sporulation protein YlmC with PRC-barrel domain
MEFRKPLILSFSLLAFASASALAEQAGKQNSFSELDRNNDGSLSQMEAAADPNARSRFEQLDQNGDQKLSRAEYEQGQKSAGAQSPQDTRTSQLIGMEVTDRQGKDIGEIEDVVIDLQGGKVHAAVLSFGGFMGIGEKQFAFPVSELKPGKEDKLTMDIDKQKLENREGFAQGQWPAMDDEYWGRVGGQGKAAAGGGAQQAQKMTLVRASELKGKSVSDNSGKEVGEIEDVIVDLNQGQVKNIAIQVEDGGGQAMVKPDALAQGTGDKLLISMSADELKSQAKQAQGERPSQRRGAARGGGYSK